MEIRWNNIIADFGGLLRAIVQKTSRGAVSRELRHDKATINGWLSGGHPKNERDVAALIRLALKVEVDIDAFQTFEPIYDFSPMLSHEERVELGAPGLRWIADPGTPIPEFPVNICGMKADCPLGISSSPLLGDEKWAALMLNLGFGISVLKTKRTTQKQAWEPPHIAFVLNPPPLLRYDGSHPPEVEVTFNRARVKAAIPNLVNSLGVPSDSPADWQLTYQKIQRHARGGFVGLSVLAEGETAQAILKDLAAGLSAAAEVRPPFIELNVSCPNLEKRSDIADDVTLMADICTRARRVTKSKGILLAMKLPPQPEGKMRLLLQVVGKLIDIISFQNTTKVRPITRNRDGRAHGAFIGREFGGLSGPCTFQTTLAGVQSLVRLKNQLQQSFGIMAGGGIASYGDVVELLNAGADVTQACTSPIFDPLLALKVRYRLSQPTLLLKRKSDTLSTGGRLLLPRDQVERDSFGELEDAVKEIQRRSPDREIPYDVIVSTWNGWMSKRSAGIDTGAARRVATGRRKAEWIRDLL